MPGTQLEDVTPRTGAAKGLLWDNGADSQAQWVADTEGSPQVATVS